ncbi:MAG: hypothetical protein RIT45_1706, partial [Pseudomonadota bacterium]
WGSGISYRQWYTAAGELGHWDGPHPSPDAWGFRLYIGPDATLGTKAKPAESCKAILDAKASLGDGSYWLDPDGAGGNVPFQAYCDMTTDGGGWTMLLTATATGTYWGNNSPNWTKPGTTQPAVGFEDTESHSPAYGLLATKTIRLCHASAKQCFNFDHDMNLSLQAFFTQGKRFTAYSLNTAGVSNTGDASLLTNYSAAMNVAIGSGDVSGSDQIYCDWLGINLAGSTSALGWLHDENGGCGGQSGNGVMDDGALGIGLNSCYDANGCFAGGSGHTNGRWRNAFGKGIDSSGDTGPWFVLGR